MLALYLFSLVLGGSFLLLSIFGGAFEADADFDADVDLDVGDAASATEADGGHDTKIFSIRSLIYALFGFGGVGTALTFLGISAPVTAAAAVVGGTLTGALVASLFGWLRRTEAGPSIGDDRFVGLSGRVTLPLSLASPGTIVVDNGRRSTTLRALPHGRGEGDGDPGSWRSVVIVEMERGVARVAPVEEDLVPRT